MYSKSFVTGVVSVTLVLLFGSQVLASYDSGPGYGVSHSSYAASPVAVGGHGQGWGNGHSAGSYYHYHVPLVGQQQSHYPPVQQQSNDHHLYYLLPLLLLAALPLLFLPLLPLLLLPLGLSLLGLLLPLLMMGGMMMMMMMDGGMMMMMMRNAGHPHRNGYNNGESRGFSMGDILYHDLNSLVNKYARSLDLDHCPERVVCEAGSFIFPENATEAGTARTIMNFLVEQAAPKGKTRRILRSYKQAFWSGSKNGNCTVYKCQPVFRIFEDTPLNPEADAGFEARGSYNNKTTSSPYNPYGQPNTSYYGTDVASNYYYAPSNVTSTFDALSHHPSAFKSYYSPTNTDDRSNANTYLSQSQRQQLLPSKFKPKAKPNASNNGQFVSSSSTGTSYTSSDNKLNNDVIVAHSQA